MPTAVKRMPMDLAGFLQSLARSRLLAPIDLEACQQWAQADPSLLPQQLGFHLLRHGKLSRYQMERLLSGRSHSLILGPFEVLAPLGQGGMGIVFLARDHEHQRLVALKLLSTKQQHLHPNLYARLEREMKFARSLTHPHIVKVFSLTEHDQVHCLAMELVPGLDLGRHVRRTGPMPAALACRCLAGIALALEAIHRRGIVHTDVKPGNILLTAPLDQGTAVSGNHAAPTAWPVERYQAKLIDFGLALDLEDASANRQAVGPGRIAGTFAYAAPEQTRANQAIGPAADLYALGSTLFFVLIGQPPFPGGTTKDKIKRVRHEPPPRLRSLQPDLPLWLDELVNQLLAKRPKDRPKNASIVADRLFHGRI